MLGYLALLTGMFWLANSSLYTKVFYGLVAFPALLALVHKPRRLSDLIREPMLLAFLALSAWLLLSLTWSGTEDDPGGLAKRPLYVFMLFASCTLIALEDRELLLKALKAGAALAALAALVNLVIYFMEPPLDWRLIGVGALRNPLLTSHVFGMFCAYWIAVWLTRDVRRDWVAILCAVPLLAALMATGSRTPLLALALMSVWMLIMTPRRAAYLVAIGVVLIAASFFAFPELLLQRGLSFRPQIWGDALGQALQHLWLGYGYGSSFTFHAEGLGMSMSDPHNVELAVLLELGLVGLLFWLMMYGFGIWRCFSQRKHKGFKVASALLVYGIGAGLTEGSSFLPRPNESWFLIWIPLSLVAALSISQRALDKQ
ncbi:O-antigen ligase family protein [Metapseudomonas lalkuanensis]|uniref:O-antigen ligase family protein n=1 Tax=Metapseudomonas lalkuanensis TaxID=2604832 RepID=UPI001CF26627|nr:O-antigen ligase family protein [Pseudomonas lalkuanensis]UCO97777.1 O-antigen ligase family protein [Pseudomonas lalkuanensis]